MNKELEAMLLRAAKAMRLGVVGVDPARAHDFGVPVGQLVQAGQTIPGSNKKAKCAGYYCPRSNPLGVPAACLVLHVHTPDPRKGRWYQVATLDETSTGMPTLSENGLSLQEVNQFLRGLECAAYYMRERAPKKGR